MVVFTLHLHPREPGVLTVNCYVDIDTRLRLPLHPNVLKSPRFGPSIAFQLSWHQKDTFINSSSSAFVFSGKISPENTDFFLKGKNKAFSHKIQM